MLSWSNNIPSRARILYSKFCSVCERQQHNCLSCFNDFHFQVDLYVLLPARLLLWESFDIYKSRQAQAAEEGKNLKLESHYFNSFTLALNSHSSSDSSLLACFFPNIVSGIENQSRVESTWMAHKSSRYSTQQHTNLSCRSLSFSPDSIA